MAKLLHNVTLELFVKANDSIGTAYRLLDKLAPLPVEEVRGVQWRWHPERQHTRIYELPKRAISLWEAETRGEEGTITVITYRFAKQRDTKRFVDRLREAPDEERATILANLEEHIDADGRLMLRINLEALRKDIISLAPGKSLMARANLAAYPKNWETCVAAAERVLGETDA